MKTMKLILGTILIFCLNSNGIIAQQNKYQKTTQKVQVSKPANGPNKDQPVTVRPVQTTGTTMVYKKPEICKPMDIRRTEDILRDRVGRSLKVHLDKDYGFIEIMGNKQNMNFGDYKIEKAGHDWVYTLNDIKSTVTRIAFNRNAFVMTIQFEDDDTEIKGRCPGCKVGQDNRAPDINWENPSLIITMVPAAENNSFTFNVTEVKMGGSFDFNGMLDKFLPPVALFFQRKMEDAFKNHMQSTFNSPQVKRMLTEAYAPEITRLGLGSVKRVDMSQNNIFLCNY